MKTFYTKTNDEGLVNNNLFFDIRNYLAKIKNKHIKIDISIKRKLRSNSQNKLYWAWLGLIAGEATAQDGQRKYTSEDFHLFFREMLLGSDDGIIKKVESTTELNTKEFTNYLNNVQRWVWESLSSEFIFPNPEDLYT